MKPGDIIRFREITIDKAQELFAERDKLLRKI
jgi:allophanate hydrolase subunit 2